MVSKTQCMKLFNATIRGTPLSFEKDLIPLVSDYLTEINYEKSDKMINLIVQNPQLIQQAFPVLIEYYCRKYNIFRVQIKSDLNNINYNFKTILYYE